MKAFTLVETLVAITVVLLAIMGPFQLVKDSLLASYAARDQITATALAEEALEYVRYQRDSNYLAFLDGASVTWLTGLTASPNCVSPNKCSVDSLGGGAIFQACAGGTCSPLQIDDATGYYVQNGDTTTRFTRSLTLEPVDGGTAKIVKVVVTVTYVSNHVPFTVTVSDYLYNWL